MSKQEIRPALKNPRHEAFAQAHARGMSASAAEENAVLIKKPEKTIKRDEAGRFDRHCKELSKTSKKADAISVELNNSELTARLVDRGPEHPMQGIGSGKPGPGRPKGSKNKLTVALREMILNSLDRVGGEAYLMKLAVENSSAYASLLGKVLPSTIQAADSNGGPATIEFQRIIVMPDGHRHIEGKTPLQLSAPASHELPKDEQDERDPNVYKDLDA